MRKCVCRKLLKGLWHLLSLLFRGVGGRVLPYHPKSGEKDLEGPESRLAMCLLEFEAHKRLVGAIYC